MRLISNKQGKQIFGVGLLLISFLLSKPADCQTRAEVLPTPEQVAWAEGEMGVIIHLDINIYAPETFDYSKKETLPNVDVFNPSKLNTDQWVRTAKTAGAKYALLTAKHGTGFCLWPSKVNEYNVGYTKWRNGRADIVKDFVTSCKKYGLKPGLYYNTNINSYYGAGQKPFATEKERFDYNKTVLQQLTELWSNYGKMFEIWFDGGILSDEKDGIESSVIQLIREKQPQAILFQGPLKTKQVIRWVGNEDGVAAYPQWSRTNASTNSLGLEKIENLHGEPEGKYWCPAESDFPIRKNNAWNGGWLWRANQESYLFTPKELVDKYYKSIGRNTNMLIGMVVDTSGLVPRADSLVFDGFGKRIKQLFSNPVSAIKNGPEKELQFDLLFPKKISQVVIQEDIRLGENIRSYSIEAWIDNGWKEIATGLSVGHKRIQALAPVTVRKLRFKVKACRGQVAIKKITFY